MSKSTALLISGVYYGTDRSQSSTLFRAFIINHSKDTLKYWSYIPDEPASYFKQRAHVTQLFGISDSMHTNLASQEINDELYEQTIIPPGRSKMYFSWLLCNKIPPGAAKINVGFKLYRWVGFEPFTKEIQTQKPELLTDSVDLASTDGITERIREAEKAKLIPPITELHVLTPDERGAYTITADETKIKKATDQRYANLKTDVYLVPTTVHNNSDVELQYLSWSASPEEYYHVNNIDFKIPESDAQKNGPIILSIPAKADLTVIIPVIFKGKITNDTERLKVGININKKVDDDAMRILTFFILMN